MLEKELINAGLDEIQSKVYLAALELGETNISRIAKKAGVKRTSTYLIIDSLRSKGLIHTFKKRKRTVFYAEDPRKIKEIMEERMSAIDRIMPAMLSIANFMDNKPNIRFYEQKEGLLDIYKDILKYPNQRILAWHSESFIKSFGLEYFNQYFIPRRIEKKISFWVILPDNEEMRKLRDIGQEQLRITKLIDPEKYKIEIEIMLYGKHKTSIISFEEQTGFIIESKKIYDSMASIFETMWALIPDYKPRIEDESQNEDEHNSALMNIP
jgi:sugar-specific transcriptional regulator TrmB